jgi:hypothetical protein
VLGCLHSLTSLCHTTMSPPSIMTKSYLLPVLACASVALASPWNKATQTEKRDSLPGRKGHNLDERGSWGYGPPSYPGGGSWSSSSISASSSDLWPSYSSYGGGWGQSTSTCAPSTVTQTSVSTLTLSASSGPVTPPTTVYITKYSPGWNFTTTQDEVQTTTQVEYSTLTDEETQTAYSTIAAPGKLFSEHAHLFPSSAWDEAFTPAMSCTHAPSMKLVSNLTLSA